MVHSNETLKTITQRHCKRAFKNNDIERDILKTILEVSGNAASSKNTQPWKVKVIRGEKLSKLKTLMCQKFDDGDFDDPEYQYAPEPLPDYLMDRARDCGYSLFKLKDIDRKDREKRKAHDRENFNCFGAPVLMLLCLDKNSEKGSFLDLGLYLQNVMLACTSLGLGSCPQFSLTSFSQTLKRELAIPDDQIIVCGLSLGYPDTNATVNTFIPKRIDLNAFTDWFE
jgi:nitroreductase